MSEYIRLMINLSSPPRRNKHNPRIPPEHLSLHKLVYDQRWHLDIRKTHFLDVLRIQCAYTSHGSRSCIVDIDVQMASEVLFNCFGYGDMSAG